jgi:hypothetical protein
MFDNTVLFIKTVKENSLQKPLSIDCFHSGSHNYKCRSLCNQLNNCVNNHKKGKSVCFTLLFLFAVVLATSSFFSVANNIEHVNIGRIAVDDQSIRSQQRAGKLALEQVFVKLSGNVAVTKESEISKAIDNYEQFLVASSFIQQGQTLVFEATFNKTKVENLLLASGLSVWTSLRPSAVVWLALENSERQKVVLSQYSDSERAQKVILKAFARGVEVVMP